MPKWLPEGYTLHDGGDCPLEAKTLVDVIVRTAEGLGHSGPAHAKMQEWNWNEHPDDGLGEVLAYKLVDRDEQIDIRKRFPETTTQP